jgi:hypothetical protein
MDLIKVMQTLYASEINCGLQSMYDGGFDLWLGGQANGIKAQKNFRPEMLWAAGEWLDAVARKHYPDSRYAKEPSS